MACEAEKAALAVIAQKVIAVNEAFAAMPKQDQDAAKDQHRRQLAALWSQSQTAGAALQKCLAALSPQRVPGPQPKDILHTNFQTLKFGGNGTGNDWATAIAGGVFPWHQEIEWKQVMDTNNEYDDIPAGATGWACYQDTAGKDSIGLHPFGNDWEFAMVLDPEYLNLVSFGNTALESGHIDKPDSKQDYWQELPPLGIPSADIANAAKFGLLGVEIENGLVPPSFQGEFHEGDRVALFGRWIVDTGHSDAHTEIHPPLLLASASVYSQQATGQKFTRTLVTTRPYLTGQLFANGSSTSQIYDDTSGDDGHFLKHLASEFRKAEEWKSRQCEAHVKIKQFPFRGAHLFELTVKAPPTPLNMAAGQFVVSFHFTHRTGCSVQVVPNDGTSVRVFIVLNSAAYVPPALPAREDITLSISELKNYLDLSNLAGAGVDLAEVENVLLNPVGAYFVSKGLVIDKYAALPDVNFSREDLTGAAVNVSGTSIPPGVGITLNDTQPFPVTGWIEVGYRPYNMVLGH